MERLHTELLRQDLDSRIISRWPVRVPGAERLHKTRKSLSTALWHEWLRRQRKEADRRVRGKATTYRSDCWSKWRPAGLAHLPIPDVWHLHWVAGMLDWPSWLPWLTSTAPVVWTLHDYSPVQGIWHYEPLPIEDAAVLASWDRRVLAEKKRVLGPLKPSRLNFVALSDPVAQRVAEIDHVQPFRVETIPNAFAGLAHPPVPKAVAKAALDLEGRFVVGLCAQNFGDQLKGAADLAAALQPFTDRPEIVVLTAGWGELPEFPVPHVYLGKFEDDRAMRLFFSALDVFANPSHRETFGNTTVEALACETPVIGYDTGILRTAIDAGRAGWVLPVGDVDGFSKALRAAMEKGETLAAMGRHGRAHVVQTFAPEKQGESHLALYRRLAAEFRADESSDATG